MGFWNRISRQLSSPQGLGGRVVAAGMNRGNAGITAASIDELNLVPGQRVLEVAFGGGASIRALLDRDVIVGAIDQSDDMAAAARRAYGPEINAGRLEVVAGDVRSMPFAEDSFDRAMAVNAIYFWPDLAPALAELGRVLAPGGLLVFGIQDPSKMQRVDREIFTVRPPDEVEAAVIKAGFTETRVVSPKEKSFHLIVAVAPEN